MADRFTADKMAWLERVQDHPGLPQTAFSVAFALSRHMNRASGDAWPSQATIGAMAGVKARQVRNLIRALADAGLIEVKSGGFQKPDRYRMGPPDRQQDAALRPATDCHTEEAPDRQSSDVQTGNQLPPNPLKEPFDLRNSKNPVCVSATHTKAFQDEDEALAYVRELITKANVEADPRKTLLACQSHHGDDWQKKLKGWTAGAIGRAVEKPKPIVPVYDGPAELRADVVHERGEGYATSYLDTCRWRDEDRTILARHEFMAQRLVEDMGRGWLARREISVGVMAANDVPVRPVKGHLSWV